MSVNQQKKTGFFSKNFLSTLSLYSLTDPTRRKKLLLIFDGDIKVKLGKEMPNYSTELSKNKARALYPLNVSNHIHSMNLIHL